MKLTQPLVHWLDNLFTVDRLRTTIEGMIYGTLLIYLQIGVLGLIAEVDHPVVLWQWAGTIAISQAALTAISVAAIRQFRPGTTLGAIVTVLPYFTTSTALATLGYFNPPLNFSVFGGC